MSIKTGLVTSNLQEAQKGMRFVDAIALALMILDSLLIAFVVFGIAKNLGHCR